MARRSHLPAAVAVLAAPIRSPVLARANLVTRYRRYTLPSAVRRSSVSWPGSRRPLVLGLPLMKRIRAFDARVRMPARSECVLSAMSAALSESALTMRLNRFGSFDVPDHEDMGEHAQGEDVLEPPERPHPRLLKRELLLHRQERGLDLPAVAVGLRGSDRFIVRRNLASSIPRSNTSQPSPPVPSITALIAP